MHPMQFFHPGNEANSTENDENLDILHKGTGSDESVAESNVLPDLS